jgi:hypothetical protein
MFLLRRADYERILGELAEARGAREVLTRELAIRQQNVDWLTAHVNRLELERAELLQRVLNLTLPVPTIAREATDHPDLAAAIHGTTGLGRPIRPIDRPMGEDIGVAASALGLSSFEDMGDTLADRLGVKHDEAGNTIYS